MMDIVERRRWYFMTVASGSGGIDYLLRVEFATDDAAPVTSPYAGEVGSVTITDTDSNASVSGGAIGWTTAAADGTPVLETNTLTRAQGLAIKSSFTVGNRTFLTLFRSGAGSLMQIETAGTMSDNNAAFGSGLEDTILDVASQFVWVAQSTGVYLFRLVSGNWRLVWYSIADTGNFILQIRSAASTSGTRSIDYIRAWQLAGSAFVAQDGLAQLDQPSPSSGTDYTGTADMLADLVCTQDGSPTAGEKIQLIYRKSDANNYWTAYLERNGGNTDWDFKLDSVSGGTPTNRVTATSVGTVTRIRVLTVGTSHKVFTYSGSTWTTRGTVTVSHNDAQTTINATYDAGNTVSRLISFARESATYSELDNG